MAEFPGRIERIVQAGEQEGQYDVNITKNGEKIEIKVDDQFPCRYDRPIFSKNNGNELWVLVLEKAWAKLHGSYRRIESGWAYYAFRDLTGAPAYSYVVKKTDNIW